MSSLDSRLDEINKELDGYKDIIDKVEVLKKEKKDILKKIKDDKFGLLSFEEQFKKFYNSNKGKICVDLFELEGVVPLFYFKFVDDHFCLDRYRTYHIDMFGDRLCCIFDKDVRKLYQEELGYEDDDFGCEMEEIIEVGKELMINNIRGWIQDW